MSDALVNLTIDDDVAQLTLNRPAKRNALTREFLNEIADAVRTVAGDESARVLVLQAAGPVFCAGMDLKQMEDRAASPQAAEEWRHDTEIYRDVLVSLLSLKIPTLAAVQGPALAGGLGLMLACDMVVAADSAFFALPEPKRGITAAVLTPLLIYRVGNSWAGYILLSGQNVSAADARRFGLCHDVVTDGELANRTARLVRSILSGAPSSLAITKRQIAAYSGGRLIDQIDAGMKASAEARETSDAREGLSAFFQKRNPAWQPPES